MQNFLLQEPNVKTDTVGRCSFSCPAKWHLGHTKSSDSDNLFLYGTLEKLSFHTIR